MYNYLNKEAATVLYDALIEDPYYILMEKTVPQNAKEGMLKYYDYSMREAQQYGALFIPTGQIYGASIWSKPLSADLSKEKSAAKKSFLKTYMGDKSLETYKAISAFMDARSENLIPENHWYLSILGVAPNLQGQGLGKTLLTPILEQADTAGVVTYLETFTPRNISFYQRLGYRVVGEFFEPTVGAVYSVMVR